VADIRSLKSEIKGFIAWTEEDVAKFEAKHPIETMARLALAIMLFTGVRRSDAGLLGPPMVKDGSITFMPQKTRRQKKVLTLPILDALQDVLEKTPRGLKTWLVHSRGRPLPQPASATGSAIAATRLGYRTARPMARARSPPRPQLRTELLKR
jgi:integrase